MLSVTNDIFLNPHLTNCQQFILLDHRVAFDLVNHNALTRGLWPVVGIPGTSTRTAFYCIFVSYLRFILNLVLSPFIEPF